MNALLEVIRDLAAPIYIVLLVLSFISGLVSRYRSGKGMQAAASLRPGSAKARFINAFLWIREYVANQDENVSDADALSEAA